MAVSRWSEGQMPGSGRTSPKPVFCAIPTQPAGERIARNSYLPAELLKLPV